MDPELVDRIYESSFVPELWPGVLDELGRIAEATGGVLTISKADLQYCIASPGSRELMERYSNEGWFRHDQGLARLFAARDAGFLTDLDVFTPDELDQEPMYRDFWRPQGIGSLVGTSIPIQTGENAHFGFIRHTTDRTRTRGTHRRPKAR
ncbi:MAG: hypothetical protein ACRECP_03160 [Methylocella sp.]